jgi:hypothetical protein
MSITQQPTATAAPTTAQVEQSSKPSRTGRKLAALVAGLTLVTAGSVATWVAVSGSPEQPAPAVSPANQPGGSVYSEQVPDYTDWKAGYGPGSQLYSEQVPDYTDWSVGYGPDSTHYQEQVPAAAR